MPTTPTGAKSSECPHGLMTVGELSRRTGLSRKAIRELEGRGLIYTIGRSDGNYRLFDESALWCARTIEQLRGLGLTLAEIEQLHDHYRAGEQPPIEVQLGRILDNTRKRLVARISELEATIARIDAVQTRAASERPKPSSWAHDPCLAR